VLVSDDHRDSGESAENGGPGVGTELVRVENVNTLSVKEFE
jgi:hypothetical protein